MQPQRQQGNTQQMRLDLLHSRCTKCCPSLLAEMLQPASAPQAPAASAPQAPAACHHAVCASSTTTFRSMHHLPSPPALALLLPSPQPPAQPCCSPAPSPPAQTCCTPVPRPTLLLPTPQPRPAAPQPLPSPAAPQPALCAGGWLTTSYTSSTYTLPHMDTWISRTTLLICRQQPQQRAHPAGSSQSTYYSSGGALAASSLILFRNDWASGVVRQQPHIRAAR